MLKTIMSAGLFASLFFVAGCATQYNDLLAQNNANINQLTLGMTKKQLVTLMKGNTSEVQDSHLSNPYKAESFQRGSDNYEVLYYLTHKHPPFVPIRDSQATPVVLKNGTVVGWGLSALDGLTESRK